MKTKDYCPKSFVWRTITRLVTQVRLRDLISVVNIPRQYIQIMLPTVIHWILRLIPLHWLQLILKKLVEVLYQLENWRCAENLIRGTQ
ncbi:hypothetical protein Bhyg_17057 [Pseudolycoriella hygida]|uniref:Uncharacterized protein n=1 Tax=Pseudolycoriella hygida TaxID=35572 RepID=A0A9Q0RVG4_9DIPT|nr:hypothetical protein Bhyg_17057 [Pseudolycoriella hygida]